MNFCETRETLLKEWSLDYCKGCNIFRILFEGVASQCTQMEHLIPESQQYCNTIWYTVIYKRTDGSTAEVLEKVNK